VELEPEEMDALIAKDRSAWNMRTGASRQADHVPLDEVHLTRVQVGDGIGHCRRTQEHTHDENSTQHDPPFWFFPVRTLVPN